MNDTEFSKDRFKPLTYEQMYGVEEPEPDGRPLELDIDSLLPFPNQPFHPYKEDEMEKMVESIQENGVISPIVVRPKEDGTYEIISGHNRVEACRRAGITQIPSFIREVDDDTAVILMVDSNLRQREKLSDIEKAKAFEMKIHVTKARDIDANKAYLKKPKTKAGTRDVPIPTVLLHALKKLDGKHGLIAPDKDGKLMSSTAYKRAWEGYFAYLNVTAGGKPASKYKPRVTVIKNITSKMLRHTYCTMLYDAGVDVKSAQYFMGHSNLETTLKIYTHLSQFRTKKSIASLNAHVGHMIAHDNADSLA